MKITWVQIRKPRIKIETMINEVNQILLSHLLRKKINNDELKRQKTRYYG